MSSPSDKVGKHTPLTETRLYDLVRYARRRLEGYDALRAENAALRKRVEEAEQERDDLMENYQALGREYEMQGRNAEKVEAERDEARALLLRQQDTTIDAFKRGDKLQADLDAALEYAEWLQACIDLNASMEDIPNSVMDGRIKALLEKRRVERG